MSVRNLSTEQVAQLLRATGGNLSTLVEYGVPQNAILRALVANPDLIQAVRKSGGEQTEKRGLDRFREDFVYDPDSNVNAVLMAYQQMPDNYRRFAEEYFNSIKKTGGIGSAIDNVNKDVDERRKELQEFYGLDDDQFDDFKNTLKKDSANFIEQENENRRRQMASFLSQRSKLGVKEGAAPEDVTEALLRSQTGFSGLSMLPTSAEEFAEQEAKRFGDFVRQKGAEESVVSSLLPQFKEQLSKKVGKNYQALALSRLLSQNLMGE